MAERGAVEGLGAVRSGEGCLVPLLGGASPASREPFPSCESAPISVHPTRRPLARARFGGAAAFFYLFRARAAGGSSFAQVMTGCVPETAFCSWCFASRPRVTEGVVGGGDRAAEEPQSSLTLQPSLPARLAAAVVAGTGKCAGTLQLRAMLRSPASTPRVIE